MIDLNRAVRWPLRPLGLDPGRALANAQLSAADRQVQREELWRQVQRRFAPTDDGRDARIVAVRSRSARR